LGDLTALLHSLLEAGEDKRIPYSFTSEKGLDDVEVTGTLTVWPGACNQHRKRFTELTYNLAVFQVHYVTPSAADTLPFRETVLHVIQSQHPTSFRRWYDSSFLGCLYVDSGIYVPGARIALCTGADGKRFVSADRGSV
jgi:hypothetical protein